MQFLLRAAVRRLSVAVGIAISISPLVVTAPAWSANFTWTGGAPRSQPVWSNPSNWEGGVAPSGAVNTITFPPLPETCAALGEACYTTSNDISGIQVNEVSIGQNVMGSTDYTIAGQSLTIGAGGLSIKGSAKATLGLPIVLDASQTWTVSGEELGNGAAELDLGNTVTGLPDTLTLNVTKGQLAIRGTNVETGPITVEGGSAQGSVEIAEGELNGSDGHPVKFVNSMVSGYGKTGSLTLVGSVLGTGFGPLRVEGNASLDSGSEVMVAAPPPLPGASPTRLRATGNVTLAEPRLGDVCGMNTSAGQEWTLMSAIGGISGQFAGVPDGGVVYPSEGCHSTLPVRINYTPQSVTAIVLDQLVSSSPPSIQGSAAVGQTLTEVHGTWTGSPTSYTYQWSRCERELRCSAIPGATGQTYVVQAADVGYTILVQETADNSGAASYPASSEETGIVPPLVSPGAGGNGGGGSSEGGNSDGGGSSSGGNGSPSPPEVTAVSSSIGGTKLPGGPVSGGTQLTIIGSGFVPGVTRVWIEPDGWQTTGVVVKSPTQLTAVTPSVGMIDAGIHTIRVNTPAGSSSTTASAANSFYYYVPQIGVLVFHDPSTNGADSISRCTASVVASSNKDVISTAGHCIATGTTWHDEVVFAPGYYGPLCGVPKKPHHPAEELLTGEPGHGPCGLGPYGFWHSRRLVANQAFMTRHPTPEGLDFGFITAQTEGGKHVAEVVGGGLPIEFCAGTLAPLHLLCEAGSGATEHNWIAYGQPGASLGHCGPLAKITAGPEPNGPENLFMEPCVAITSGGSGGPWINLGGHVGAVNQTHCEPPPGGPPCADPQSTELTGTYFTREAKEAYDESQHGASSAGLPAITDQNGVVSRSGIVSLRASCPGSTNCQGLAKLIIQGSLAATAADTKSTRKPTQPSIPLGHTRFSIRSGSTAVIRVRIRKRALSRLWPRRSKHRVTLATLMLRTAHETTKVLVTLSQ